MGRVRSMRSNRARAAAAMAAVVLGAGLAGLAEAQPSPRWSLALDSGAEYDTNIHRCETGQSDCAVQAGPLARWSARLGLGWQPRPAGHLQIVGFGGARLFAEGHAARGRASGPTPKPSLRAPRHAPPDGRAPSAADRTDLIAIDVALVRCRPDELSADQSGVLVRARAFAFAVTSRGLCVTVAWGALDHQDARLLATVWERTFPGPTRPSLIDITAVTTIDATAFTIIRDLLVGHRAERARTVVRQAIVSAGDNATICQSGTYTLSTPAATYATEYTVVDLRNRNLQ